MEQWGTSANAIERDFSNTVSLQLNTTLSASTLNEARFQFSREDRPRDYAGPSLPGQSRPLPDTGIDFAGQYRFGMPFFIPVKDHDTRFQVNDNVSLIRGAHNFKFGAELNRTSTTQTFVGFANGRYIFDSVQGFMNYVNIGPKFVECSDGSTNNNGSCPSGSSHLGSADAVPAVCGSQRESRERRRHADDPATGAGDVRPGQVADPPESDPELRLAVGRADGAGPDHAAPSQVFFAPFIGKPGFPSTGNIPSSKRQFQPRAGLVWDRRARRVRLLVRLGGGIYYARTPGLDFASTRSTNGSVGQSIYRDSTFNSFGLTPPAYDQLVPNAANLPPSDPQVYVTAKNFTNPRTYTWSLNGGAGAGQRLEGERRASPGPRRSTRSRFVDRNDPVFGSPWGTGLGADKTNGIGQLTTLESSAKSLYRGLTIGLQKQMSQALPVPDELPAFRRSGGRRQRARSVQLPLCRGQQFQARLRLLRPRWRGTASMCSGWWNGAVGHRFLAADQLPHAATDVGGQSHSANGYIVKRNTIWKNNTFFAFDFRAAKNFKLSERVRSAGDRGRVQSDESGESQASGDHQLAVQFRWHGAERAGRSAAGATWAAVDVLGQWKLERVDFDAESRSRGERTQRGSGQKRARRERSGGCGDRDRTKWVAERLGIRRRWR